ncbi:MAG: MoxR family ATPase [Armatimonadota bacterium]|nr:MAG: MoxR family ATPase [Armatimonadota bacterium]
MTIAQVAAAATRIVDNVSRVIFGKREVIEDALVALLCAGHVLFEDVPGVGKTMLARAFAASLGCTYKRIQFTPDLLPSDVTGVSIYDQGRQEFRFVAGPVFANVVLADEINRASPKTQSALLECMEEGQVTVDGVPHRLPQPFVVMATENPIEYEGTYPLPELQLDRFMMRLRIGYPEREVERSVVLEQQREHPIRRIEAVTDAATVVAMQHAVREVRVEERAQEYILDLVAGTRNHPQVYLGASPRGSLYLFRTAQALAAVLGLDYVLPDHLKRLAPAVLGHRIIVRPEARIAGTTAADVIAEILSSVPVD